MQRLMAIVCFLISLSFLLTGCVVLIPIDDNIHVRLGRHRPRAVQGDGICDAPTVNGVPVAPPIRDSSC